MISVLRAFVFNAKNGPRKVATSCRHMDKWAEKARGDELNYFLKLTREQLVRFRQKKVVELAQDIDELESELQKMKGRTSNKSIKARKDLVKEINKLNNTLKKYKRSLDRERNLS